jgi:hypothetical protein
MAPKYSSRPLLFAAALAVLISALQPAPVRAGDDNALEQLPATGVYVKGEFTLSVIQQPDGDAGYVAPVQDTLTQFSQASRSGSLGLLAHNYLAGQKFFNLEPGDRVYVFHQDRGIEVFVVTEVLEYQAMDPSNPYSDFRDLTTGAMLTAGDLFNKVYTGERHVTFQTCIERDGEWSWGRLFVIAEPAN